MTCKQVTETMQTILAGINGMSTNTVTLGDEGVLDRGVDRAIKIEDGDLSTTPILGRQSRNTYGIDIYIYVRFTNKKDTAAAFRDFRDTIVSRLQRYYPDVGNLVDNPYGMSVESISSAGAPQDVPMNLGQQTGGPVFRGQILTVSVSQTEII